MDKVHEDGTPRPERCLCIKCINQYKREQLHKVEGLDTRWDPISPAFNIRVWFE